MAWLAVDERGEETIFQFHPRKQEALGIYIPLYTYSVYLPLPKGTIKKIIGYDLTWKDEPVEIKDE